MVSSVLQRYNGLDCCGTLELYSIIEPQLGNGDTRETYIKTLGLLGPILRMMLRGVLINPNLRSSSAARLRKECAIIKGHWEYLTLKLLGEPGNINSPVQLKAFFYEHLKYPPQYKRVKGQKSISTDRAALEALAKIDTEAEILTSIIIAYRERTKLLEVLNTGLEPNGRFRTNFNPAGTVTGRFSSSENPFRRGTNGQNITEELRKLFIADVGYKFWNIDYEQVDSRNVALEVYLTTGDDSYLLACESGDLHTQVAKMTWPELPWTGDPKTDKAIAERPFYRHYSYRFMCKKLGHGSNYLGRPPTLAKQSRIDLDVVEAFQARYFEAFPGIPLWHQIRIEELQTTYTLTTILGRRRQFHGRVRDEATWREAIAFLGQSPTADLINTALRRIDEELPQVENLLQVHDNLLGQAPEEQFDELFPQILNCFQNPITVVHPDRGPRTHVIPADGSIGWNWSKRWTETSDDRGKVKLIEVNRDGLDKWRGPGSDDRKTRWYDPAAPLLDRRIYEPNGAPTHT